MFFFVTGQVGINVYDSLLCVCMLRPIFYYQLLMIPYSFNVFRIACSINPSGLALM